MILESLDGSNFLFLLSSVSWHYLLTWMAVFLMEEICVFWRKFKGEGFDLSISCSVSAQSFIKDSAISCFYLGSSTTLSSSYFVVIYFILDLIAYIDKLKYIILHG